MNKKTTPLMLTPISAGFPSPGEETVDFDLDLTHFLIRHPAATFLMRVAGESMKGAGIFSGDIVIVDKSLKPKSGDIVVAHINGEFTLKRFVFKQDRGYLMPENSSYKPTPVDEDSDFTVWGVVTHTIHEHRSSS